MEVFTISEKASDQIWNEVKDWDYFSKKSMGIQWIRAIDSIGANIAESYGRYHYSEKVNFLYYARGSVFEAKFWLNRALASGLINEKLGTQIATLLSEIAFQLNAFTKSLKNKQMGKTVKSIREKPARYE